MFTSHRLTRLTRFAGSFGALLLAGSMLAGCEGLSAAPTCQEFANMSEGTGLGASFTDEQNDAVRDALDAEGFDDGAYNLSIAHTEIISYCNIYEGNSGNNQDVSIREAIKD